MANPIYERLPGETGKAWRAFQHYRNLGPYRNRKQVVDAIGTTIGSIQVWAARYNWMPRVAAWDDAQSAARDKVYSEAMVAELQTWAKRNAEHLERDYQLGEVFRRKAEEMLKFGLMEHTRTAETYDDGRIHTTVVLRPVGWRMVDAATLARLAQEIQSDCLIRASRSAPEGGGKGLTIPEVDDRLASTTIDTAAVHDASDADAAP